MTRAALAVLMSVVPGIRSDPHVPGEILSPIPINKATAKDLQTALGVTADVAEAIVAYPVEKGDFKTVDDVKKVPGLEAAKIDALRSRVVF